MKDEEIKTIGVYRKPRKTEISSAATRRFSEQPNHNLGTYRGLFLIFPNHSERKCPITGSIRNLLKPIRNGYTDIPENLRNTCRTSGVWKPLQRPILSGIQTVCNTLRGYYKNYHNFTSTSSIIY